MVVNGWRELYPFESRFAEIGGHRMHYVDEGSGEPVVFVHGNPTWSFQFRNLVLGLRDRRRTIALDHVGCGLSDKPGDAAYDYTLGRRVDDLEALLARLVPEGRLSLVLHDWGGMIGMAWAVRHPGRVARIALANTAAFGLPPGKPFPWQLSLARGPLGALFVRGFDAFVRGTCRYCVARPMAPAVRAGYHAPYGSWAERIAVHRFVQDIPLSPRDRAHAVLAATEAGLDRFRETPAMILWGERDFVFDGPFLAEWVRRWPHAEVHRFPDASHLVVEDEPDEVLRLLAGFLP